MPRSRWLPRRVPRERRSSPRAASPLQPSSPKRPMRARTPSSSAPRCSRRPIRRRPCGGWSRRRRAARRRAIPPHPIRAAVKVCGTRDEAGVRAAVAADADFAGFVLASDSPRCVTPERAGALARDLAGVRPVLVLRSPTKAEVARVRKHERRRRHPARRLRAASRLGCRPRPAPVAPDRRAPPTWASARGALHGGGLVRGRRDASPPRGSGCRRGRRKRRRSTRGHLAAPQPDPACGPGRGPRTGIGGEGCARRSSRARRRGLGTRTRRPSRPASPRGLRPCRASRTHRRRPRRSSRSLRGVRRPVRPRDAHPTARRAGRRVGRGSSRPGLHQGAGAAPARLHRPADAAVRGRDCRARRRGARRAFASSSSARTWRTPAPTRSTTPSGRGCSRSGSARPGSWPRPAPASTGWRPLPCAR